MNDKTTPQGLLDHLIEAHQKFYEADPQAQLNAMLLMVQPDGEIVGVLIEMNDESRDAIVVQLKVLLRMHNAVMYGFASEAWMKTMTKAEVSNGLKKRISEHEDKEECVITLVVHEDGSKLSSIQKINRDWTSGDKVLTPRDDLPGVTGPFASLFEE